MNRFKHFLKKIFLDETLKTEIVQIQGSSNSNRFNFQFLEKKTKFVDHKRA